MIILGIKPCQDLVEGIGERWEREREWGGDEEGM
jgi:hypothetical protein